MDQDSVFLKHVQDRREEFKPNPKLNELIGELRSLLEPVQHQVNARYRSPRRPVTLVIGCPRSGTTLLFQALAMSGGFAYPSNLLERFAYAPYFGARIQQMLLDPEFDYREELADLRSEVGFSSTLGRTKGALAVSEFYHFWRRFLPVFDPQHIPDDRLSEVGVDAFRAELASLEDAFGKPWVCKGIMAQFNLPFFAERMPELLFLYISRPPIYLMQSIYKARQKYYGSPDIWWSVKPREYDRLATMSPVDQVAGQVYYTVRAIERGLDAVDPQRVVRVAYDEFCQRPAETYRQLSDRYRRLGDGLPEAYRGEDRFRASAELTLAKETLDALESAYQRFERAGD